MSNTYDVIVVGAGNGGLAAGAFLAKNGHKTLILDQHNIPGGSATSFVRGRFEFETSLHELACIGNPDNPGAIRGLFSMLGSDVEWVNHMGGTFRLIVPEEGIDADMPTGIEAFIKKMEEVVPGSGASTAEVFRLAKVVTDARAYMASKEFDQNVFNEKYPEFYRICGHTITEVLDALGMPKKAQNIISSYWCYLGAPADEMDFATYASMLTMYVVYGAGQPKYRSHEISLSLEKVVRDHGGDIWYNSTVDKILVKDGKAYGVEVGGKEYYADEIVCNAYPNKVYGTMIDPEEVPERAVKLVNARELGLSFITVYLGMNKTREELGIESYSNFIGRTSDSRQQYNDAHNTREYGHYVILNCLNDIIPDCTPEGTCQLFLTHFNFGNGWDNVKPEEYEALKEKIAREMIEDCERGLGISISPYIEEIVIAAPPTFARYLSAPQGTPYGYQMNKWDNYIQRGISRHEDQDLIKGLHFVGAATHRGDGYSTAYLSGLDAGQDIMMEEKQKGEIVR